MDKREMIIQASIALFAEYGFYGTQVPLIAERANVGVGTIYRYFQDKTELVNAAFQTCQQHILQVWNGLPNADLPVRQQFHEFWRRLAALLTASPEMMQFLEFHNHAPYLDEVSLETEQRSIAPLRLFFRRTIQEQMSKDVVEDVLVLVFMGIFAGLVKEIGRKSDEELSQLEEVLENMCWEAIRR